MPSKSKSFHLVGTISTDNPTAVRPVLDKLVKTTGLSGKMEAGPAKGEFLVDAEFEGTSAKDLNRSFLSELRRAEKKTRLRAEWTFGNTTERYFDYVLKKTVKT